MDNVIDRNFSDQINGSSESGSNLTNIFEIGRLSIGRSVCRLIDQSKTGSDSVFATSHVQHAQHVYLQHLRKDQTKECRMQCSACFGHLPNSRRARPVDYSDFTREIRSVPIELAMDLFHPRPIQRLIAFRARTGLDIFS